MNKPFKLKIIEGDNTVFFNKKRSPLIPEECYEEYKEELAAYERAIDKCLKKQKKREKYE